MRFLADPPQFLFFTGKGGVGKTSLACATAISLAETGKSVLLVSTDPASNVAQVLGQTIGNTITSINSVPGLFALEIDPEEAKIVRQSFGAYANGQSPRAIARNLNTAGVPGPRGGKWSASLLLGGAERETWS